jgi:hypothetical protein
MPAEVGQVMDEHDLTKVWDTYHQRRMWELLISRGRNRDVAEGALAELDKVTHWRRSRRTGGSSTY